MNEKDDQKFPELDAFEAEQARRHRFLVSSLAALGTVLIAIGCAVIIIFSGHIQFCGWFLLAVGSLMIVRAGLSRFTSIDTKLRNDEWVGVVTPDDWKTQADKNRDLQSDDKGPS